MALFRYTFISRYHIAITASDKRNNKHKNINIALRLYKCFTSLNNTKYVKVYQ